MVSSGAIRAGKAYVEITTDDSKLTRGLRSASKRLKKFAASTKATGRAMMRVAATIGAPLAIGTKVFAEFGKSMAEVSTMLDAPEEHMNNFRQGIRKLSVDFGESTTTLSKGLYDILSASIAPEKALDVLAVAAQAAKAGLTDTGVAADALTTILNAYGLEADRAGDVSDWLFSVVKGGKTTFGELAPNIGKVAALASNAGLSLEELGAMIATLTRNGVQTEQVMTAVTAIIGSFLKPTDDAREAAKSLGFEMNAAALRSEGLEGVFRRLGNLPPDAIAKLFPNIRAMKGLMPALQDFEGFTSDIAAMNQRAGQATGAFEKMAGTMSHKFDQAKQAIIDAFRAVGQAIAIPMQRAAETVQHVAERIGAFIKEHEKAVVVVGALAVILGTAGAALYAVGVAAGIASGVMYGLSIATGALTTAFTFLMAHPVVLALAGIAAAAVAAGVAIRILTYDTAELSKEAASLTKANDKLRVADLDRLDRLEQLSKKEKLTNSEMAEAENAIKALESHYGSLGLAVDTAAGKLNGFADAQSNVTKQMRKAVEMEIKAQIAERQANVEELQAEMQSVRSWSKAADEKKIESLFSQAEAQSQHVRALVERLKALRAGEQAGLTGETGAAPGTPGTPGALGGLADQAKLAEAARINEESAKRLHDLKIEQIQDEERRALSAIQAEYAKRLEQAVRVGADIAKVEEAYEAERSAIRDKFRKQAAAKDAEEAKRRAAAEERTQDDIARLQIETTMKGLEKQLALVELERTKALRDAAETGESATALNRKFDLQRQLAQQGAEAGADTKSVRGIFNAAALQSLQGGRKGPAEETAANTKAMNLLLTSMFAHMKLNPGGTFV